MKIRIKGNSIRLRLTRTEVESLYERGSIEEQTHFLPGIVFTYKLAVAHQEEKLKASFFGSSVVVFISSELARVWGENKKVGYSEKQENGTSEPLFILVEKDFQCLDETHEDQADNYPNPRAAKLLK